MFVYGSVAKRICSMVCNALWDHAIQLLEDELELAEGAPSVSQTAL